MIELVNVGYHVSDELGEKDILKDINLKLDDRFVAKKEWWINNRIHEEYIKPEVFFSIDELYVIP